MMALFSIFRREPQIDYSQQHTLTHPKAYYEVVNTQTHRKRQFASKELADEYVHNRIMRAPKW